jgi:GntP family gluconate:H+ symporter
MNSVASQNPAAGVLLLLVLVAIAGLVVLVARFKLNAFLALILASLFVGLCSGMELPLVAKAFQEGVGRVLGDIAMVVGLGAVLGKLLAESGGAQVIANTLVTRLGERRLPWAMMLVAFVIGLPVFFGVGLVLLVPILFTLARRANVPLLRLGIPLVAALSVAHGLVPPHPGPMAAAGLLRGPDGPADLGKVILYSIVIGLPTAVIAGPLLARRLAGGFDVPLDGGLAAALSAPAEPKRPVGFGLAVFTILLPVALMLLATAADVSLAKENVFRRWAGLIGSPLMAMTLATVFALWSFGAARGFDKGRMLKFSNDCLGPVAIILLVVGAGGGFSRVLVSSGVGDALGAFAKSLSISPLILGWVLAALIRVATGSATVAITAAAGLIAPVVGQTAGLNLELLIIAMGAGSLVLSHVNDGGFWLVKEYLNLSVPQTLKTWTVVETVIAVVALLLTLLLDWLLR